MLHNSRVNRSEVSILYNSSTDTKDVANHNISSEESSLTTMILPVYVSTSENSENEVLVYAHVDKLSDTVFIDKETAGILNAATQPAKIEISTMTTQKHVVNCGKISELRVRGMYSNNCITIRQVYAQMSIPGNRSDIPVSNTAKQWNHLKNLAKKILPLQPCKIALLIGYDCSEATYPISQIQGSPGESYGIETVLGQSTVGGFWAGSYQVRLAYRILAKKLKSDQVLKCLQDNLDDTFNGALMYKNDVLFMKMMRKNN